jgi:hypothetical protein
MAHKQVLFHTEARGEGTPGSDRARKCSSHHTRATLQVCPDREGMERSDRLQ